MSQPMLKDEEETTFHEDQAGIAPRSVTDFPCCFVFLFYMVPRRAQLGGAQIFLSVFNDGVWLLRSRFSIKLRCTRN